MRILFVHQNFPGQYGHIAAALAAEGGHELRAIAKETRSVPKGVEVSRYDLDRSNSQGLHPLARDFDSHVARGESAARCAMALKQNAGFSPDIICGHPGWGETLFMSDVWPDAKLLTYSEFYFRGKGADFGFDPEMTAAGPPALWRLQARNASLLASLMRAEWSVSPTRWQWSQLPEALRERASVIHDGIDTDRARPDPGAELRLQSGLTLRPGDEVITFVNRNFEPYRGFHIFMRALPRILARRPNAHVILVGGDKVSYGRPPPPGTTYRKMMLKEVGARLDMSRVHFVGRIPHASYLQVLQVSAVHVYLTVPFVLSWSMLESMAAGCVVVGSRTAPVTEVLEHGRNGLLVDFLSPEEVAQQVCKVLEAPLRYRGIRHAARQTVLSRFDLRSVCLPAQLDLIRTVALRGEAVAEAAGGIATLAQSA